MLQPKRVTYRKVHRGHRRGPANSGNTIAFGEFGLQALGPAGRQPADRGRSPRYHPRPEARWKSLDSVFPDKPVTAKPAETRMGSGKGAPDHWVAVVKPGRMLFEVAGVEETLAKEALRLAAHKLPVETRLIVRDAIL